MSKKSKRSRPVFWVDLPTVAAISSPGTNDFENVANFTTRRLACKFIQETWGGDGKGNINLITEGQE